MYCRVQVVEAVPTLPEIPLPAIQPNYRPLPSIDVTPLSPQRRKGNVLSTETDAQIILTHANPNQVLLENDPLCSVLNRLFLLSVPVFNDEEDAGFTGKRFNSKMVVYSGSKTSYLPKMMTLYEQCIRVLQNNIDCEWSCVYLMIRSGRAQEESSTHTHTRQTYLPLAAYLVKVVKTNESCSTDTTVRRLCSFSHR